MYLYNDWTMTKHYTTIQYHIINIASNMYSCSIPYNKQCIAHASMQYYTFLLCRDCENSPSQMRSSLCRFTLCLSIRAIDYIVLTQDRAE